MSAILSDEDKKWLRLHNNGKQLNGLEEAVIEANFDTETDQDHENIIRNMTTMLVIKKLCVLKLILFVPEQLFTRIFLGSQKALVHRKCSALYLKVLRNKLTLVEFNKSLLIVTKNSIII